MYSRMLGLFPASRPGLANMAATADLQFYMLIGFYILIVILLGMILDSSSIMLIIVPLMLPVILPMQVDLVWFGIITVLAVEQCRIHRVGRRSRA